MHPKERTYYFFARLSPKAYRDFIAKQLIYAGYKIDANLYLGPVNLLAILVFIGIAIFPWALNNKFELRFFLFGVISILLIELIAYLILYYAIEDRRKRVEEHLPDMLHLVSANLRAGMSPYQALKLSAIKDFGPLKEEIDIASAKAYGIDSFASALLDINKRIKSETLDRALKLFTTAMKSGGHMAQLLEELANDISETKALKRELVTSTKTYSMFIMFIVIFGAPLLMAISIHFVDVISGIQSKASNAGAVYGLSIFAGEISITSDFLTNVAVVMLIVTSILAGMLMGVIKEGKAVHGLRYVPFIGIACLAVFYVVRWVIGGVLG